MMMNKRQHQAYYSKILESADHISRRLGRKALGPWRPQLGVILGSGLGEIVEALKPTDEILFSSIPHFPRSSTSGHTGVLARGEVAGMSVCSMQGRIHYYECGDLSAVTLPIRVLAHLGIRRLIVTNAAGGINRGLRAGDLMLIRDHIGLFFPNPLVGMNFDELGPRFPDMSRCYSQSLRELALKCAGRLRLTLKEGIYAALPGPSYETPAEIKMLQKLGADAVGMSTVPEVIVARQMGVECLGISCISNLAAGLSDSALSHDEVLHIGRQTAPRLSRLISALLGEISRLT